MACLLNQLPFCYGSKHTGKENVRMHKESSICTRKVAYAGKISHLNIYF